MLGYLYSVIDIWYSSVDNRYSVLDIDTRYGYVFVYSLVVVVLVVVTLTVEVVRLVVVVGGFVERFVFLQNGTWSGAGVGTMLGGTAAPSTKTL